jgi:hypothetical protein
MENTYKELYDLSQFLKSRISFINDNQCSKLKIDYQSHFLIYDNKNNNLTINIQPNVNVNYNIINENITIDENNLILEVKENFATLVQLCKNEQTMVNAKLGLDYKLSYCNGHLLSYINKQENYYIILQHILLYKNRIEIYGKPFPIGKENVEDLKTTISFNTQEYNLCISNKKQLINLTYTDKLITEEINIYQIIPLRKLTFIHNVLQKSLHINMLNNLDQKICNICGENLEQNLHNIVMGNIVDFDKYFNAI